MKLGNFLVFHARVAGNSTEVKTESIYCQDNESAHTRYVFWFPFRSAFSFPFAFVETPTQSSVLLQEHSFDILLSFINFPDGDVVLNVLVPSFHPSPQFFFYAKLHKHKRTFNPF